MGQWINGKWKYEKRDIKREGVLWKACKQIRWAKKNNCFKDIGGNDAEVDCWLARKALDIPYREICWENNLEAILKWLNGER